MDGREFINKEMLIKWLNVQRPLLKGDNVTEQYEHEHQYEYGRLRMIEKTLWLLKYGDYWKDIEICIPTN